MIFVISVFIILGASTFIFIGTIICSFVPLRVPSEFCQWYNRHKVNYRSLFVQLSQWIKHGSTDSELQSNNNSFSTTDSNVRYNYSSVDNDRLPLIRCCCVNYGLNSSEKYFNPLKINNEFGNYFENNIDNCFKNVEFEDIKRESAQYSNYCCTNTVVLTSKIFWNDIKCAACNFDVVWDVLYFPLLMVSYLIVAGLLCFTYFLSRIVWLISLPILIVKHVQLITVSLTTAKYIEYPYLIVFFLYFFIILLFGILFIKLIYFDLYYFKWISPFVNRFESFFQVRAKNSSPSMGGFVKRTPIFQALQFTKDYITDYFYPTLINNHESLFIIKHYCTATLGGQGDVISNIIIKYLGISKEFQSIDWYIDYHLRKSDYDQRIKYKILLVGTTDSGKSTLFGQIGRCQTLFDVNNYDIVIDDEENDAREVTIAIRQQIIKDVQRIIKVMNESHKSVFDFSKIKSSMNRIANIDTSISARMEINLQTIHDIKLVWNNLFVDDETALKWMAKCGVNYSTGVYICLYN